MGVFSPSYGYKPPPMRVAKTPAAYGKTIPVVHGAGVCDGVLVYGAWAPTAGAGQVVTLTDFGTLDITRGLDLKGGPAVYLFAQGMIATWAWILRSDVKFLPPTQLSPIADFRSLCLMTERSRDGELTLPTLTSGDPTGVTEWGLVSPRDGSALPPEHVVPFGQCAILRTDRLIFPDGRFPTLKARLVAAGAEDLGNGRFGAHPSDMIRDIVENPVTGFGLSGLLEMDIGPDGLAASSFDRYMAARGWHLARVWDQAAAATEALQEIADACDATFVWTGEKYRVIPLGESAVGAYSPPTTAHAFTDDDIILKDPQEDPVQGERPADVDLRTVCPVEYLPWYSEDGTTATAEAMDAANASPLGAVRDDPKSLFCIDNSVHAQAISQLRAQRQVWNRTPYRWSASYRHLAVMAGDLVTLTHAAIGFTEKLFRVLAVKYSADEIEFEAIEWVSGVSVTSEAMPQTGDGLGTNPLVPPDTAGMMGVLANIASDSVFTVGEHAVALMCWNDLSQNGTETALQDIVAKATAAGVATDKTTWITKVTALGTYLNGGTTWTSDTPSWLASSAEIAIVPATWRAKWQEAYNARTALLSATTAAAQGDADAARSAIAAMADDGILAQAEMAAFITEVTQIQKQKTVCFADYKDGRLTTEQATAYAGAWTEIAGAVYSAVGFSLSWIDTNASDIGTWIAAGDKTITRDGSAPTSGTVGSWWRAHFQAYYAAYETMKALLFASNKSALYNLSAPGGTTAYLRADGTWATPPVAGAPAWGDITSKPSTFTPSSHAHAYSDLTSGTPTLGTAAPKDVPASGDASSGQVVLGSDTRLTNSRNAADVSGWAKSGTKPSYAYSEISSTPTLGTAAAKNIPATGNASSTEVVYGSDTRLSDSRAANGGDADTLDGSHATAFLGASSQAADSDKLDGAHADTAANANTIAKRDGSGWLYAVDMSTSSDERTKDGIVPLAGSLARTLALHGINFHRKADPNHTLRVGLSAQATRLVVPEVVNEDADGALTLSYGPLVGLLIEAIRELEARLAAVEERNR